MLSGIKIYTNMLGWQYRNVEGVVLVFHKDGSLIKTISVNELNELIQLKVVR